MANTGDSRMIQTGSIDPIQLDGAVQPKIDQFIRSVRGVMMWKPFRPEDLLSMMQTVLRKNGME